jgi:hypothetical protein
MRLVVRRVFPSLAKEGNVRCNPDFLCEAVAVRT